MSYHFIDEDRLKLRFPVYEKKKFKRFCYSDFLLGKQILEAKYDVLKPEQCTGLRDKDGNLIYEGDILFVKTFDWKNKERWNAGEVKTYWSVEYKDYWNHCGFMVFGINRRFHKPLTRTTVFNSEAIVVGNIHENKELLNDFLDKNGNNN